MTTPRTTPRARLDPLLPARLDVVSAPADHGAEEVSCEGLIACLSLVLLLSSCGGRSTLAILVPDEFEDRAREVAARWQGSADDRAWRKGFVALEVMNPQGGPMWAVSGLGEHKLA